MKNIACVILFFCFLFSACIKEDICMNSGNHDYLCCKIDGKDWTIGGGWVFPYDLNYYSDTKWLSLLARNTSNDEIMLGAFQITTNIEKLQTKSPLGLLLLQKSSNTTRCKYYENIDISDDNFIKVLEIDSINYIIKGEFEFSAINECQDTIRVTDGYFDLNYTF